MVMGEIAREYDVAVLGGGPAGYMAALRSAQLGMSTLLVERRNVGGCCLNEGCIPSKTLLNTASGIEGLRHLKRMGIGLGEPKISMGKMQKENKMIIEKLRGGIIGLLRSSGVALVQGEARLESSTFMHIKTAKGEESAKFRKAVIATGSEPVFPAGIRKGKRIITSDEALFLEKVPKRLAIIGAGYIAAELGTFYSVMGSEVHVLARSRLLSHIEKDLVSEVLKKSSMHVHAKTTVNSVEEGRSGVSVSFSSEGKRSTLKADILVVAIGRGPRTSGIGLENTRVKLNERGFISVNEKMQTHEPNIYAAGDVVGEPMLAHKAFAQGRVAAEAAVGIKGAAFDPVSIPAVVFTIPEIATVGMSEEEARGKGYDAMSIKFPLTALGRAASNGGTDGFVRLVYERSGRLLGARMVGKGISELLGEAGLAIEMGAFLEDVEATVHTHPTLYEAMVEAAALGLGRPMHFFQGQNSSQKGKK